VTEKKKIELERELQSLKLVVSAKLEKLERLKQHEYDPNCKYCVSNVFVKDAVSTKDELENDKITVQNLLAQLQKVKDFLTEKAFVVEDLNAMQAAAEHSNKCQQAYDKIQAQYEHLTKDTDIQQHKLISIERDIATYNENLSIIEANKTVQAQIKLTNNDVALLRIELSKRNNIVKDLHGKVKIAEQTIKDCNQKIEHMRELSDKYAAYDLYCKAMSKDGIPYILISKAVPYLQNYVNNILAQVIDFTVELETDGKNINVFICYDGNKWPLELASGMERFISSLALRIALIKITNLPKPDFMAIDEGLGVLDSSNLNSMHAFFTYIKEYFKFTLIISHIDVVRDMVDNIVTIDRKEDFSHINC
jgi:DNA repair exonuclease SbcCD ATPase subunit